MLVGSRVGRVIGGHRLVPTYIPTYLFREVHGRYDVCIVLYVLYRRTG